MFDDKRLHEDNIAKGLDEQSLEKVTAGIDHMSVEELKQLKSNINNLGTDELTIDELGNVLAGTPMNYDSAKEYFDEHVPQK